MLILAPASDDIQFPRRTGSILLAFSQPHQTYRTVSERQLLIQGNSKSLMLRAAEVNYPSISNHASHSAHELESIKHGVDHSA